MNEESLFAAALAKTSAAERRAFLDEACAGDPALRQRVEQLLAADQRTAGVLERGQDPRPPDASPPERPGAAVGPYKLIEPIGEGGMGTVWMAQQTEPVRRLVAVKLIKAGMDSKQVLARFEAERQALALMDHPNIARVLDAGTTKGGPGGVSPGRPYFVMDLVRGMPITRYCDERRLTPRQRLELFVPVCQAVQHAHQKGIIHRDLKPSNVLVALYDGRPVPKVIDFGVAKAAGQPLTDQTLVTGFGTIVGTLEYMAPEQAEINQLDIDTRSDIYALGVILYELLTGAVPFSRKELEKAGLAEMLRVIKEREPARPSTKLSHSGTLPSIAAQRQMEPRKLTALVRGELDWIVMKALEKDRSRRYETANGFAMDVQRYLAGEPVLAAPASGWYRLRKFVRRYRGPVLAAALVLLALVGGIAGTAWGLVQAEHQRALAEAKKQEAVQQRDQAETNFAEARRQRRLADTHLYRSLIGEARAIREARGIGFRALAWKRLQQASRLATPEKDLPELRQEAGTCLGDFAGLKPTDWVNPDNTYFGEFDLRPQGDLLAVVLITQTGSQIVIRNVATGQEAARLGALPAVVSCVRFSTDGRKLFAGDWRGMIRVWELNAGGEWIGGRPFASAPASIRFATPSQAFPFFVGLWSFRPIRTLMVSPDGTKLAAGYGTRPAVRLGPGTDISVWNLADASPAPTFSAEGALPARVVMLTGEAFSPRGDLMAAGFEDGNASGVLVWDVATRKVKQTLRPGFGYVFNVCFSADGKNLACACNEGVVLFDTVDFHRQLFVRGEDRSMVAFSPDGRLLAILAPESGFVRLWNIATNREIALPSVRDPYWLPFVRFTPDGKRLVSAGSNLVRIWNLAGAPEKQTLVGHSGGISGLAFSPDGKLLASASKDFTVRLWDVATARVVRGLRGFNGPPQSVAFDPDGRFLATSEYLGSGAVNLWEVRSGKRLTTVPPNLGPAGLGAAFSPNGKHFVVCGQFGVKLWNVVDPGRAEDDRPGLSFKEAARPTGTNANSACFSPDGRFLAWVDVTRRISVSVWELATGQKRSWPAKVFPFLALSFLPDGKQLVLVNRNEGKIEVHDAADGQVRVSFGRKELIHGRSIHTALSPDGAWLAVGGDKAVTVWDINKRELLFALPEERGTIWSLAWSPDKNLLAVGSSTGGLVIWNMPRIKTELSRIGLGW
jgi:WD40 repeat protein/serine/threonine protein kinase